MQSAQLAQCAGTRDRPALRRPNPPNTTGKDAMSLTEAGLGGLNLQKVTDALPNAIVVSLSELSSADGIHRPNLVVGTSRNAM